MSYVNIPCSAAVDMCKEAIKQINDERLRREIEAYDLERKKYENSFFRKLFKRPIPSNEAMKEWSSIHSSFRFDLYLANLYAEKHMEIAKKVLVVCEQTFFEQSSIDISVNELYAILQCCSKQTIQSYNMGLEQQKEEEDCQ